jgi:hypothetical protein
MKKLNSRGFSHDIAMMLVVVVFAIGGVGYLVASHADSCNPTSGPVSTPASGSSTVCPTSSPTSSPVSSPVTGSKAYLMASPKNITATVSKANAQPDGLVYGPAVTITGVQNTTFELKYKNPTSGQGFYIGSGGIQAQQTLEDQPYVNATKPDGKYTGTAVLQYMNNKGKWAAGPTLTYSLKLTN